LPGGCKTRKVTSKAAEKLSGSKKESSSSSWEQGRLGDLEVKKEKKNQGAGQRGRS